MRLILRSVALTAILFSSFIAKASHLVGGSIRYENVTTSSTPAGYNEYYVEIELLRDPNGITLPTSLTVYSYRRPIGSYSYTTHTFSQSGTSTYLSKGCGSTDTIESSLYSATLLLVEYGAYDLKWYSCCRNANIDNLATPNSEGSTILATLVSGKPARNYNNSPTFDRSLKSFPVGKATFPICTSDPDGDSLYIELIAPHDNTQNSGTIDPVTFATGYSLTNPFGDSATFSIDTAARTITVESSIQQVCAIAIKVSEYVKDTSGVWRYYGSIERDEQYFVTAPLLGTSADTLAIDSVSTPNSLPSDSLILDLNFEAFPVMFEFDSVQMTLSHANQSAYVESATKIHGSNQLILRTDTVLSPGSWKLNIGQSTNNISLYNRCGSKLNDSSIFKVNIPLDSNFISGPDSAYVNLQQSYHLFNTDYVDSVVYSITNGFLWNPTSNPNDTIEITWTLPPGEIQADVFIGDTVLELSLTVNVYGIGLEENQLSSIRIAPQPTNGNIQLLGYRGTLSYSVFNSFGQLVLEGESAEKETIRIAHLPSGTYYMRVWNDQASKTLVLLKN